ncbi:hypothetical protein RFI_38030, partial [Reticulomyxa filosa]
KKRKKRDKNKKEEKKIQQQQQTTAANMIMMPSHWLYLIGMALHESDFALPDIDQFHRAKIMDYCGNVKRSVNPSIGKTCVNKDCEQVYVYSSSSGKAPKIEPAKNGKSIVVEIYFGFLFMNVMIGGMLLLKKEREKEKLVAFLSNNKEENANGIISLHRQSKRWIGNDRAHSIKSQKSKASEEYGSCQKIANVAVKQTTTAGEPFRVSGSIVEELCKNHIKAPAEKKRKRTRIKKKSISMQYRVGVVLKEKNQSAGFAKFGNGIIIH